MIVIRKLSLLLALSILISMLQMNVVQAANNKYIKIDVGQYHIVAIKEDGTVWSWGENQFGCLGDDTKTDRYVPKKVEGICDAVDVACGIGFTIVLKKDGTVWGWGSNYASQLGFDNNYICEPHTPMQLPNLHDIVQIDTNDMCTFALGKDGKTYTNCIEDNVPMSFFHKKPSESGALKDFKIFDSDRRIALGIKNDNTVWKWELSDADLYKGRVHYEDAEPTELKQFKGARDVAVTWDSFFIICADGSLVSYGNNVFGQLGNGFTSYTTVPYQIEGITDVKDVSALKNVYILHNDGTVSILYDLKK